MQTRSHPDGAALCGEEELQHLRPVAGRGLSQLLPWAGPLPAPPLGGALTRFGSLWEFSAQARAAGCQGLDSELCLSHAPGPEKILNMNDPRKSNKMGHPTHHVWKMSLWFWIWRTPSTLV